MKLTEKGWTAERAGWTAQAAALLEVADELSPRGRCARRQLEQAGLVEIQLTESIGKK